MRAVRQQQFGEIQMPAESGFVQRAAATFAFAIHVCAAFDQQSCIAFVPHCTAAWMCHPSYSVVTFFCDLHDRKRDESHYYDSVHLD